APDLRHYAKPTVKEWEAAIQAFRAAHEKAQLQFQQDSEVDAWNDMDNRFQNVQNEGAAYFPEPTAPADSKRPFLRAHVSVFTEVADQTPATPPPLQTDAIQPETVTGLVIVPGTVGIGPDNFDVLGVGSLSSDNMTGLAKVDASDAARPIVHSV